MFSTALSWILIVLFAPTPWMPFREVTSVPSGATAPKVIVELPPAGAARVAAPIMISLALTFLPENLVLFVVSTVISKRVSGTSGAAAVTLLPILPVKFTSPSTMCNLPVLALIVLPISPVISIAEAAAGAEVPLWSSKGKFPGQIPRPGGSGGTVQDADPVVPRPQLRSEADLLYRVCMYAYPRLHRVCKKRDQGIVSQQACV